MKLHLGCGAKFIPGFVHVDINNMPHIDHVCRIEKLSFLKDETVDLIYAAHVLEHFGRHEVLGVLKEWHRVLKPKATLRLAVPDFNAVTEIYKKNGLNLKSPLLGLVCGGQRDEYDFHKMIFNEELLTNLLLEAGFGGVVKWDWRLTDHSSIDDYSQSYVPHMDKEQGTLVSLNLEARKE